MFFKDYIQFIVYEICLLYNFLCISVTFFLSYTIKELYFDYIKFIFYYG